MKTASFMAFNVNFPFGKFTAIVKMENGMSEEDARRDAWSLASAGFGPSFGRTSAGRFLPDAHPLTEIPEGAWEVKKCEGWGWMMRGYLP